MRMTDCGYEKLLYLSEKNRVAIKIITYTSVSWESKPRQQNLAGIKTATCTVRGNSYAIDTS